MDDIIVWIIILLFMGYIVISSSYGYFKLRKCRASWIKSTGVITNIEAHWSIRSRGTKYTAYFKYEYMGVTYDNLDLKYCVTGMKVGDEVDIYINPDNPKEYMAESKNTFLVSALLGLVFVVTAIICIIVKSK